MHATTQGMRGMVAPALRALQRGLTRAHEDMAGTAEANLYTLRYLCAAGKAIDAQAAEKPDAETNGHGRQAVEVA